MNPILIYFLEEEVGPGLPSERSYRFDDNSKTRKIGQVILPHDLRSWRNGDMAWIERVHGPLVPCTSCIGCCASGLVRRAIQGDFGMTWEADT